MTKKEVKAAVCDLVRPIFCPICSARLFIPTTDAIESGPRPVTYILPDHTPAIGVNLCQGVVVKVLLDWAKCEECGCNIPKHPTGLCMKCFSHGANGKKMEAV